MNRGRRESIMGRELGGWMDLRSAGAIVSPNRGQRDI